MCEVNYKDVLSTMHLWKIKLTQKPESDTLWLEVKGLFVKDMSSLPSLQIFEIQKKQTLFE